MPDSVENKPLEGNASSTLKDPAVKPKLRGKMKGGSVETLQVPTIFPDVKPEDTPSISVAERVVNIAAGKETVLPLAATDFNTACSILMDMIKSGDLIFDEKQSKSLSDIFLKEMPKEKSGETLKKWIALDIKHAYLSLLYGIKTLTEDRVTLHDSGACAITSALQINTEKCCEIINYWKALTILKENKELNDNEHLFVISCLAGDFPISIRKRNWMWLMASIALMEKLPFGAVIAALQSIPEHSMFFSKNFGFETFEVDYTPIAFDFLDRFPNHYEKSDLEFIAMLKLTDPECLYKLIPVILSAAINRLIGIAEHQTLHDDIVKQINKIENKTDRNDLIKLNKALMDIYSEVLPVDYVLSSEKHKAARVKTAIRRVSVRLIKPLEELVSKFTASSATHEKKFRAFLLTCLGVVLEASHNTSKVLYIDPYQYYIDACHTMPSRLFVHHIVGILIRHQQYDRAKTFLSSISPELNDPDWLDDDIKMFQPDEADYFQNTYKPTAEEIDHLMREYDLIEPAQKLTKNQRKKRNKENKAKMQESDNTSEAHKGGIKSSVMPDEIKAEPKTATDNERDSVPTPSVSAMIPIEKTLSPKPETDVPAASNPTQSMIGGLQHLQLLPEKWHPEVFQYLSTAQVIRKHEDAFSKEKTLLEKGIKKLSGKPGVECLHYQVAWNLINHQRDSMAVTKVPGELKKKSKAMLDKAEQHLFIALGKKLGVNSVEAKSLFDNNNWWDIACTIRDKFSDDKSKYWYCHGVQKVLRSIGHVNSERLQYLAKSAQAQTRKRMQNGYMAKSFCFYSRD